MDPFKQFQREQLATSQDAFNVTPNDNGDLPAPTYGGFWVSTPGTVKVTTKAGTVLTLPSGQIYWNLVVTKIWATGTSATGIVGLV
ncbi:hypothetical protein ASD74_06340 [Rhizobium sp. Root564]|nr:hypothetical protein ASD74_06340 [Rhizobium sp. Root564]